MERPLYVDPEVPGSERSRGVGHAAHLPAGPGPGHAGGRRIDPYGRRSGVAGVRAASDRLDSRCGASERPAYPYSSASVWLHRVIAGDSTMDNAARPTLAAGFHGPRLRNVFRL